MEKAYFSIVKWWTSQKPTDKLFAFMLFVIIGLATTNIKIYGQNATLQETKYIDMQECERRALIQSELKADKALKRSDSLRIEDKKQCETEIQNLFEQRTPHIKSRTQKIENALR